MRKKASPQRESSALDVRLIRWDDLPFRSHPKIMEIWGQRDAEGLKVLIDADRGNRDALRCARIRGDNGKPILFDGYTRLIVHFARKAEGMAATVPAHTVEDFDSLGDVLEKVGSIQAVRRNRTQAQIAHMWMRIMEEQGYDIAPKPQGRQKGEKRIDSLKPLPSAKAIAKRIKVSDPIIRATQQAMAHPDPTLVASLIANPQDPTYLAPAQVVRKIEAHRRQQAREARQASEQERRKRIAQMAAPAIPDEIKPDGLFTVDAIEGIKRIAPGTVALVCTSIPYACTMPYDNTPDFDGDYEKYLDTYARQFLLAVKPAMTVGGRVAINFDCTYRPQDGKAKGDERYEVPNVFNVWKDISAIAQDELGMLFMGYRIWYKQNCPRTFATGSRDSRAPRMNPNTEFILIFAKDSLRLDGPSDITQKEYDRFALTHWYILPQQRKNHAADDYHPCPYPEEIPYRLIKMYCPKGGIVLDPYSGSGTTAFVAKALGRGYIGLDNSGIYNGEMSAAKRLATLDGLSAAERIQKIERFVLLTEHGMPKHKRMRGIDTTLPSDGDPAPE